jgi:hypothetical protein
VNIPSQRPVKGEKFNPTAEEGILLGWKGRSNYVAYFPSRPGHFHRQIVQTSSLTARKVVSEVEEGAEDEVIADSVTVKPQVVRTLLQTPNKAGKIA